MVLSALKIIQYIAFMNYWWCCGLYLLGEASFGQFHVVNLMDMFRVLY